MQCRQTTNKSRFQLKHNLLQFFWELHQIFKIRLSLPQIAQSYKAWNPLADPSNKIPIGRTEWTRYFPAESTVQNSRITRVSSLDRRGATALSSSDYPQPAWSKPWIHPWEFGLELNELPLQAQLLLSHSGEFQSEWKIDRNRIILRQEILNGWVVSSSKKV